MMELHRKLSPLYSEVIMGLILEWLDLCSILKLDEMMMNFGDIIVMVSDEYMRLSNDAFSARWLQCLFISGPLDAVCSAEYNDHLRKWLILRRGGTSKIQIKESSMLEIVDSTFAGIGIVSLMILDLHGCWRITDVGISAITQGCPQLQSINLSDSALADASMSLIGQHCHGLTSIDISHNNQITDAGISALTEGCPQLLSIDVTGCSALRDDTMSWIGQRSRGLRSIKIGCEITDAGIHALTQGCPLLQSIDVAVCSKYSNDSMSSIGQHCHGLTSININYCDDITDAGICALTQGCPLLQSINLSICTALTDIALSWISQHCRELTNIHITSGGITDAGISALAQGHPQLKLIDFNDCIEVTDVSLYSIGQHCHGLTSININYCRGITDAGICALTQGCPLLQSIDMHSTTISDVALSSICQHCHGLTSINIMCCYRITDAGISVLRQGCPSLYL